MARESKQERHLRRRATLEGYVRGLERKLARNEGHPLVHRWQKRLADTRRELRIHELRSEIDDLQKTGDHSISVPTGHTAADGQAAEG